MGIALLSIDKKKVTIQTEVPNANSTMFRYVKGNYKIITSNGFKGIMFYFSSNDPKQVCLVTTAGDKVIFKEEIDNTELKLEINDNFRAMFLNEKDLATVNNSILFFESRLAEFKYDPKTKDQYKKFVNDWNTRNPTNTFDLTCPAFLQPKQTIKDDILTVI